MFKKIDKHLDATARSQYWRQCLKPQNIISLYWKVMPQAAKLFWKKELSCFEYATICEITRKKKCPLNLLLMHLGLKLCLGRNVL